MAQVMIEVQWEERVEKSGIIMVDEEYIDNYSAVLEEIIECPEQDWNEHSNGIENLEWWEFKR